MVDTYPPTSNATDQTPAAPAGLFQIHPNGQEVANADIAAAVHRREYTAQAGFAVPRLIPPALLAPAGMDVVRQISFAGRRILHLEDPGNASVLIQTHRTTTSVQISGSSHEVVAELWASIRKRVAAQFDHETFIPCQLCSSSGGGANSEDHEVLAIQWADVRRNYSASTSRALDLLMPMVTPSDVAGRLLLWHGPAGTGKTTAITSLMTEWLSWCDTHIITDPEQFFMAPDYLMDVTRRPGRTGLGEPLPRMDEAWPMQWKLIICEDADEYLRSDARQRSGPALGRLLNLTDGLLGRGTDTIVLLTTNDDLGRLHPAVTRPGRCLAAVEFPALSASESAAWCPKGVTPPADGATLAELFALAAGGKHPAESHTTGFYL